MKQALADPSQKLEAYTEAMAAEDDELMAGVVIDADS
jgi:antitoxin PrlF